MFTHGDPDDPERRFKWIGKRVPVHIKYCKLRRDKCIGEGICLDARPYIEAGEPCPYLRIVPIEDE